jgi:hypothetical protein
VGFFASITEPRRARLSFGTLRGARSFLDIEFLKTDFELLAQAMKQEAPIFRTAAELTEDLFTAAKGWPQVKCDNWGRAIF